jgi:hypothetical protein
VRVVEGDGAGREALQDAGVARAELLLACTSARDWSRLLVQGERVVNDVALFGGGSGRRSRACCSIGGAGCA